MNLLLDTNILIYLSKYPKQNLLSRLINPGNDKLFVSVASLGELKSIALQNNWGQAKWKVIETILQESVIIEINENLLDTYAHIDAFSQRRNADFQQYLFDTPRNMGKNDLWIAATAALLNLMLVTTDADFNHLHKVFFDLKHIAPETFLNYK